MKRDFMAKKAVKAAVAVPPLKGKVKPIKAGKKAKVLQVKSGVTKSVAGAVSKKKTIKKKAIKQKTVKKKPATKKPVRRKAKPKVKKFPEFPVEKEMPSFFSRFFKRKKKLVTRKRKFHLTIPTLHKKPKTQVQNKHDSKPVKKKTRIKFSIWWLLPPFLRPRHARIVKVAKSAELKAVSQEKERQKFKNNPAKIENSKTITTGIDYLLNYVEEKGKVNIITAKNKLGISDEIIYEWVSLLENHKFIVVYYPTIGPAELMSPTYAAKHKLRKETPIKELEETDEPETAEEKKKFRLMFRRKKE